MGSSPRSQKFIWCEIAAIFPRSFGRSGRWSAPPPHYSDMDREDISRFCYMRGWYWRSATQDHQECSNGPIDVALNIGGWRLVQHSHHPIATDPPALLFAMAPPSCMPCTTAPAHLLKAGPATANAGVHLQSNDRVNHRIIVGIFKGNLTRGLHLLRQHRLAGSRSPSVKSVPRRCQPVPQLGGRASATT